MRWVVALLVVIGCSKDSGSKPAPLVGKSRDLVEAMCACRDAACAQQVDVQWNEVAKDQTSRQLSADDVEALADLTNRYTKCMSELRK